MARPLKKGLEYFPLDSNFFSNRKTQRLIHRFGCNGVCIYLSILCDIYGENGYYIPFGENLCFDTSFTLKQDEQLVREVLDFCVAIHLFDENLLKQKQVLSSIGIQMRFNEISKRSPHFIDPALDLYSQKQNPEKEEADADNGVSATKTGVSATKTPVNVTETPINAEKTPTNGNVNLNGNTTTQNSNFYGNQTSTDNGEAERKAELLRMAAEATGCGKNA